MDGEHSRLHQVHHVEPQLQDQGAVPISEKLGRWLVFPRFVLTSALFCSLKLQGEKDWQKYETARRLKKCVDRIRNQYREDWKSKEMRIRQRAVALYFIDKVRLVKAAAVT